MKIPSWFKRVAAVVVTTTLKLVAKNNKVDPAVVDVIVSAAKGDDKK